MADEIVILGGARTPMAEYSGPPGYGLFKDLNEAFATQYLAVEKELGLARERTNVNGGAISIGHPLGASGTRITLHLLLELRRRNARVGVASACIGGGQGIAIVVGRG